jgi:hypothetical protein
MEWERRQSISPEGVGGAKGVCAVFPTMKTAFEDLSNSTATGEMLLMRSIDGQQQ